METPAPKPKSKPKNPQIFTILKALKQASHNLHKIPNPHSPSIKPLLELEHESESILSNDPHLTPLSTQLTHLKTLVTNSRNQTNKGLKSFVTRRVNSVEISQLAAKIETGIQAWIDREFIDTLTSTLTSTPGREIEDEIVIDLIEQFEERISKGFDRELQDSILRKGVFDLLEKILTGKKDSDNVRETVGFAIAELVKFNKDVFVGHVLMSETVTGLISLSSAKSIQVLCKLIKLIKSPIVDELESKTEIPKIVSFLSHKNVSIRVMALDCVMEIGYFGRKEVIEAMLEADLVKKLVELENGGDGGETGEMRAFVGCVARFAVQVEVGEGLRRREKRAMKVEILKRVGEAHVSDAEVASIVAEVLWGASG